MGGKILDRSDMCVCVCHVKTNKQKNMMMMSYWTKVWTSSDQTGELQFQIPARILVWLNGGFVHVLLDIIEAEGFTAVHH